MPLLGGLPMTGALVLLAIVCAMGSSVYVTASSPSLTAAQSAWLWSIAQNKALPSAWPGLQPSQAAQLHQRTAEYEVTLWADNMPFNQTVGTVWTGANATGSVYEYDDVGDSAAWTGHALTALALQYNVTRNASLLPRVRSILDSYDRLTTCTGKVGFLARFLGKSDNLPYHRYYNGSNHAYTAVPPYQDSTWLGSLSKDMYMGTAFGLASTWVFVADPSIRAFTQMLIERMVDRLSEDTFFIDSPKPHLPIPPNPLLIALYMRLGLTVNPAKYAKWNNGTYSLWLKLAKATDMTLSSKWSDPYFPNHLSVVCQYALTIMEVSTHGSHAAGMLQMMLQFATSGKDHLTADFYAFYLSARATAEAYKVSNIPPPSAGLTVAVATGLVQGLLLEFTAGPIMDRAVNLTSSREYEPHHDASHSEYAQMPSDRIPDSYLWQRAPTRLVGGHDSRTQEEPTQYILPYWLARSAGAIPAAP